MICYIYYQKRNGDIIVSDKTLTIADRIQMQFNELTRAERQLAHSILENYPASGLGPLAALAADAKVSVPTVARMVQKLGFKSYPEFQAKLREEFKAKVKSPIAKHDSLTDSIPTEHILNLFTDSIIDNIHHSLTQINPNEFDHVCSLLSELERHIFIAGGRVTRTLAEYFYLHLQMIRPKITYIQPTSHSWPHHLLDIHKDDIVVVFDTRRYENNSLKMAELAKNKGAKIILITDQWQSPIHSYAYASFNCRIEAPSAWDSLAMPSLLVESMIASIQNIHWERTKERMEQLEDTFDKTKLFRKFI